MSKAKTPQQSTTESKKKAAAPAAASKARASATPAKKSSTTTAKAKSTTTSARKAAPQRSTATAKTAKKSSTTTKAAAKAPALSKTQARLHKKMLEERDKLVRQAEDIAEEQRALAADPDAAEISSDLESGDCVASREREVDLRLAAQIQETIDQIDRATDRIGDGTYGDCTRCHSKIPAARLDALPYAELCVTCQQAHERLYY